MQEIDWIKVNCEVMEAVCRLLTTMMTMTRKRRMVSEELPQGSEAAVLELAKPGGAQRGELVVECLELVAPMSAAAWRTLATWLEEVEEGVVLNLHLKDEAARVGEREVVRSCWQRLGRLKWEEFSDEAFERYWARVSGK